MSGPGLAVEGGLEQAAGADSLPARVRIVTELGDIVVALHHKEAPRSAAAFVAQLDAGMFSDGSLWRSVSPDNDTARPPITIVQASVSMDADQQQRVEHEPTSLTGLAHRDGAVSFARLSREGSSPTTFFISLGDQPALDAGSDRVEDGLGFSVFGQVVEGMELVREVHGMETTSPPGYPVFANQVLKRPVKIYGAASDSAEPCVSVDKLCEDYWTFLIHEYPLEAEGSGDEAALRNLGGQSLEDAERRARFARAIRERAQRIDTTTLDKDRAASLVLLQQQVDLMIEGHELASHLRPSLFPFGFIDYPELLLRNTPMANTIERERFLSRWEQLPDFLADSFAALKEGARRGYKIPSVIRSRMINNLERYLSERGLRSTVIEVLGEPAPVEAPEGEMHSRFRNRLEEGILPALQAVLDALKETDDISIAAIGICETAGGRAFYRHLIRKHTSLDLDPDELHETGNEEVRRIKDELSSRVRSIAGGEVPEGFVRKLHKDTAKSPDALFARVCAIAKTIDGGLPTLFSDLPRQPFTVRQMPSAMSETMPPGLAQPGPADRSSASIYWLTAIPGKCPTFITKPLTLHEAWPGHLMQFAIANELHDLPAFRRFRWSIYNSYIEGWALYAESLGYDLGLYEEPEAELGYLTFQIWRACRLVVDTGIHWFGWSRSDAVNYLGENSFLDKETIESEVDRYIAMPGQALAYKIGEMRIRELRTAAEEQLGSDFNLRDFHRHLLATGPVSLGHLTTEVREWIEEVTVARKSPSA